ncbi:MAG: methyltransferase domain-containing protein [Pseudomonadota bacterium]
MPAIYDERFYDIISDGSLQSARRVLGFVFALYRPASLLDVGCGAGTWLAAAQGLGLFPEATLGIDGAHVPAAQFRVDRAAFQPRDLAQTVRVGRRFDLVVSVEVAEHLPLERAPSFVEDLAAHGDTILFSAATPNQGGVHHVNEQWPDYWAALFSTAGFVQLDVIRPQVWADDEIAWWYRQNAMIYTSDPRVAARFAPLPSFRGARLVHPERFAYVSRQQIMNAAAKKLGRILPRPLAQWS